MKKLLPFITKMVLLSILVVVASNGAVYAQDNTAKIYVMRKQTIGTPVKPEISINDVSIGGLPNKKYIECVVPAGKITISFYSSWDGNSDSIEFNTEGGKTYYVKGSVNLKGGGGIGFSNIGGSNTMTMSDSGGDTFSLKLSRLTDSEGSKLLKKCKEELVTDLTDFISTPSRINYAQQETVSQSHSNSDNNTSPLVKSKPSVTSDVDKNIPITSTEAKNTFVLIIANEDYAFADDVEFALNDGRTFKEYCIKTLGVPERQIWLYENASLGILSSGVSKMVQAMNIFNDGNAIIYYCGHGIPDEKSGSAYIIPVDGKGTDASSCYSLSKLYKTMAESKANRITYFMDACFSGANREGNMLVAARGVAREPKKESIEGNTIVFSAASGDETAMPFKEKGHGLFTYFLLKKLQESKGDLTYGELADYINENVKREAFLTNEKPQNPVVVTSNKIAGNWAKIKLK